LPAQNQTGLKAKSRSSKTALQALPKTIVPPKEEMGHATVA